MTDQQHEAAEQEIRELHRERDDLRWALATALRTGGQHALLEQVRAICQQEVAAKVAAQRERDELLIGVQIIRSLIIRALSDAGILRDTLFLLYNEMPDLREGQSS